MLTKDQVNIHEIHLVKHIQGTEAKYLKEHPSVFGSHVAELFASWEEMVPPSL